MTSGNLCQFCFFLMNHCLVFSCQQPTIPYCNRNWIELNCSIYLYLFISVYSSEIINNHYNMVSLVNCIGYPLSYSVFNLNLETYNVCIFINLKNTRNWRGAWCTDGQANRQNQENWRTYPCDVTMCCFLFTWLRMIQW